MLQIQGKADPSNCIDIVKGQISIGRDSSNDAVISCDMASGFHATLFNENGKLLLVDLGSTNGTYHNGSKINSKVELKPWDSIQFGNIEFEVVDPDARKATVVQSVITDEMIAERVAKAELEVAKANADKAANTSSIQHEEPGVELEGERETPFVEKVATHSGSIASSVEKDSAKSNAAENAAKAGKGAWKGLGLLNQIVYFPFGLFFVVFAAMQALLCFLSIIGIPTGLVVAKTLGGIFNPVGKVCVSRAVADELERRKGAAEVDKRLGKTA